jgi:hypothetical protein
MKLLRSFALLSTLTAAACAMPQTEEDPGGEGAFTSNDGTVLELRFDAEVITSKDEPARQAIVSQLQYTQGIFTTDARANGQVGLVVLSAIKETEEAGKKKITYTAQLPVVWPKGARRPTTYDLPLPKDTTSFDAFNDKYDGKCGRNEYGRETFWHDFNPKASGCTVDDADVVRAKATVRTHPQSTTGKYPEYDQVWADDRLDVVAVFGIISSNTPDDEGAREFESVLREVEKTLTDPKRTDGEAGHTVIKDATVTGKVTVGGRARDVSVTALLVESVSGAGSDFDARYLPASENADLVVYSGHSGLGKNINALAQKTRAKKGKYQLVYLNGCQTFAYLGTAMHDKRIALNADDPEGTKYLDIVANALPAYGDDGATSLSLYRAMLAPRPRSYSDLLRDFSRIHLVAVFGEHDNTFKP